MKSEFFKKEKESFFKGVPKEDGSGKGMRLNKGRGGCSLDKQRKSNWADKSLKLAGGAVLLGAGLAVTDAILS